MVIKFDYYLDCYGKWTESLSNSNDFDNFIKFDQNEEETFYLCWKGERPESYKARLYKVIKKKKCKECGRELDE